MKTKNENEVIVSTKSFRWIFLFIVFGICSWGFAVYQLSKLDNDLLIAVVTLAALMFLILGILWGNEINKSEFLTEEKENKSE